jgi:hypothetical protein
LAVYAAPTTPFGVVEVPITSFGLIVRLNDWVAVCAGLPESVAVTVNVDDPAVVGVPAIAEPLSAKPAGKLPAVTAQLTLPVPPLAVTVALYVVPAMPLGTEVVVMANCAGLMVRLNCCVAETGPSCPPEASVTFTVKLAVPALVGVPDTAPPLLKASPAGREDPLARAHVNVPAPPVAARVAL